uniref:Uncharacterized protein n=1 Tax=Ixodes ricinus TaxID=34613 RepID=A0A6B0V7B0_IXORI
MKTLRATRRRRWLLPKTVVLESALAVSFFFFSFKKRRHSGKGEGGGVRRLTQARIKANRKNNVHSRGKEKNKRNLTHRFFVLETGAATKSRNQRSNCRLDVLFLIRKVVARVLLEHRVDDLLHRDLFEVRTLQNLLDQILNVIFRGRSLAVRGTLGLGLLLFLLVLVLVLLLGLCLLLLGLRLLFLGLGLLLLLHLLGLLLLLLVLLLCILARVVLRSLGVSADVIVLLLVRGGSGVIFVFLIFARVTHFCLGLLCGGLLGGLLGGRLLGLGRSGRFLLRRGALLLLLGGLIVAVLLFFLLGVLLLCRTPFLLFRV